MAFTDITQQDLVNKGVVGLPDVPNLNTLEMQEKLDEIALDVIVPKFNTLVEELMAKEATASIGSETGSVSYHFEQTSLTLPAHYASTLKELLLIILSELAQVDLKTHEHENAEVLDEISSTLLENTEGVIELLYNITGITDTVSSSEHLLPTCKAIVDYIQELGGGDMLKSVYDANDDGVADVSVEELTDYDGATPSDGQVLTYDDGAWGPKTPVSSFSGASDTNIVSPTDGQIPIYDYGTGKWENKSPESTLANTAKPIQSNVVRGMASDVIETLGSGASKSYATGDPVLCSNGKWYIAGTDISQGTTLSNGGNLDESSQREIYTNLTQSLNGLQTDFSKMHFGTASGTFSGGNLVLNHNLNISGDYIVFTTSQFGSGSVTTYVYQVRCDQKVANSCRVTYLKQDGGWFEGALTIAYMIVEL